MTPEENFARWRRLCPDISEAEVADISAMVISGSVDLAGVNKSAFLVGWRAGRRDAIFHRVGFCSRCRGRTRWDIDTDRMDATCRTCGMVLTFDTHGRTNLEGKSASAGT